MRSSGKVNFRAICFVKRVTQDFIGWFFRNRSEERIFGCVAAAAVSEEFALNDVRFAACNNQQVSTRPQCIYAGAKVDQVMKFVSPLLAGKAIGMMSLTEAGGGSDALGKMKTTATRDGDVYRLNGSKMLASMANETDVGVPSRQD